MFGVAAVARDYDKYVTSICGVVFRLVDIRSRSLSPNKSSDRHRTKLLNHQVSQSYIADNFNVDV